MSKKKSSMGPSLKDRTTNPVNSSSHPLTSRRSGMRPKQSVIGKSARSKGRKPATMRDQAGNTEPAWFVKVSR